MVLKKSWKKSNIKQVGSTYDKLIMKNLTRKYFKHDGVG